MPVASTPPRPIECALENFGSLLSWSFPARIDPARPRRGMFRLLTSSMDQCDPSPPQSTNLVSTESVI